MKYSVIAGLAVGLAFGSGVLADEHLAWPASEGASVYFINLEDGATLSAPVLVQMGVRGMGVAPAGTEREGTGHHHLLVNRPPLGEGEDGEDEWLYALPADKNHVPFGPQMVTAPITITVE